MESLDISHIYENPDVLLAGTKISLKKVSLHQGADSKIDMGGIMVGTLKSDLIEGNSIYLKEGGNTSPIFKLYKQDGKLFVDTATSTYEITRVQESLEKTEFMGLTLHNEFGDISLPSDAMAVQLNNDVVDITLDELEDKPHIYINKPALRDILLEIHGGEIFNALGRFMVLTKVHNIHLPFYISSNGTSGKHKGEWYPFFGYDQEDDWVIKGRVDKNGDMLYHPAIAEVQDILNNNLIIPIEDLHTNTKQHTDGKIIGLDDSNGEVIRRTMFDLNDYLKYQNSMTYADDKHVDSFVRRITGYNPEKVRNNGKGSAQAWVHDVVSHIE